VEIVLGPAEVMLGQADGVEAALEFADEDAAAEAEKDRAALLDAKGDVNHTEQIIEEIHRRTDRPDGPKPDGERPGGDPA